MRELKDLVIMEQEYLEVKKEFVDHYYSRWIYLSKLYQESSTNNEVLSVLINEQLNNLNGAIQEMDKTALTSEQIFQIVVEKAQNHIEVLEKLLGES